MTGKPWPEMTLRELLEGFEQLDVSIEDLLFWLTDQCREESMGDAERKARVAALQAFDRFFHNGLDYPKLKADLDGVLDTLDPSDP